MKIGAALLFTFPFLVTASAAAQNAPDLVWQAPNPNGLSNSVMAVAWSPVRNNVAVGSTDRWFRIRRGRDGTVGYSVLEPQHSQGPGQTVYSIDGGLIGVENRAFGLSFRVQTASDGAALGNVIATVGQDGLLTFAPDSTLLGNTGGDGTLSRWRFSDFTFFRVTGSGYPHVTTAFNISPNGLFQTSATQGQITVQQRSDGSVIEVLDGGSTISFSPDSSLMAAWSFSPANEVVLWRTSDWSVFRVFPSSNSQEGVRALRFTPDGRRLVATGYDPYLDSEGLWQQKGFIRFLRIRDGAVQWNFDEETDIAVTSPVAWSPDGTKFAYGRYDGTVAVANTPP